MELFDLVEASHPHGRIHHNWEGSKQSTSQYRWAWIYSPHRHPNRFIVSKRSRDKIIETLIKITTCLARNNGTTPKEAKLIAQLGIDRKSAGEEMVLHQRYLMKRFNTLHTHFHPLEAHEYLIQRANVRKPTREGIRIDKVIPLFISNLKIEDGKRCRFQTSQIAPQRNSKRQRQY